MPMKGGGEGGGFHLIAALLPPDLLTKVLGEAFRRETGKYLTQIKLQKHFCCETKAIFSKREIQDKGSFLIDQILGIDPNDNIFSDFQRPGSKVIDTTRSQEKLIGEEFLRWKPWGKVLCEDRDRARVSRRWESPDLRRSSGVPWGGGGESVTWNIAKADSDPTTPGQRGPSGLRRRRKVATTPAGDGWWMRHLTRQQRDGGIILRSWSWRFPR